MDRLEEYMPQLIVGLDSLDDTANYIHINDAIENTNYYCPCCKGLIKPKAYKKEIDYKVQPHFCHNSGGCSDETYIHYICKNWLFEKGCKFIVCETEYEVDHIEIEQVLHTSFGDYKPDIIVTTTVGEVFYFEIKVSNKKTELYSPKWDELGNDVIEVDVRYFINQKYKNDIPVFQLIYSNGECFIKSYSRGDYEETIAKRKFEWERQDKLNYKIQWERLDWFWIYLQQYAKNKNSIESLESLKLSFKKLVYEDKIWVYLNIKNKSCMDMRNVFKEIINEDFMEWLRSFFGKYKDDNRYIIDFTETTKMVHFYFNYYNDGYKIILHSEEIVKYKGLYQKKNMCNLESIFEEGSNELDKMVKHLHNLERIPYVQKIVPYGGEQAKSKYPISKIKFNIHFQDNFYNKHIYNPIGVETWVDYNNLTKNVLDVYYDYYLDIFQKNFYKNELYKMALEKDFKFMSVIRVIGKKCDSLRGFKLKVSENLKIVKLIYSSKTIYTWEFKDSYIFGEFEEDLLNQINEKIFQQIEMSKITRNKKAKITRILNSYIKYISNHPTTKWSFKVDYKKRWIIGLLGYEMYFEPNYCAFPDDNLKEYIEQKILEAMIILKDKLKTGLPFYDGAVNTLYPKFRLMEER